MDMKYRIEWERGNGTINLKGIKKVRQWLRLNPASFLNEYRVLRFRKDGIVDVGAFVKDKRIVVFY